MKLLYQDNKTGIFGRYCPSAPVGLGSVGRRNNRFDEQKKKIDRTLGKLNRKFQNWDLLAELELHAVMPYYWGW